MAPSEYLAIEVHLYGWVALQLTEDVLDIVHDVGQVNEIIDPIGLGLRLLLRLLSVHSLAPTVSASVTARLLRHLANQVLYILQIVQSGNALHSSQELLEVLAISRHLLAVAVVGVLLLILVRAASVSILIMGHAWSMPPSLALSHLWLMAGIGDVLLLVMSLAAASHVLRVLTSSHLLLPSVYVLLVARIRLYVVQLLIDQVELRAVIVDVIFVLDSLLAVVNDLLFD